MLSASVAKVATRAIQLGATDNVAVALEALEPGSTVPVRDSTVVVVVSRGPDVVTVDDYRGMTVEDAVMALEEAGLEADVVSYRPFRRVKQQDPPPGTQVRRNETVTLYL